MSVTIKFEDACEQGIFCFSNFWEIGNKPNELMVSLGVDENLLCATWRDVCGVVTLNEKAVEEEQILKRYLSAFNPTNFERKDVSRLCAYLQLAYVHANTEERKSSLLKMVSLLKHDVASAQMLIERFVSIPTPLRECPWKTWATSSSLRMVAC